MANSQARTVRPVRAGMAAVPPDSLADRFDIVLSGSRQTVLKKQEARSVNDGAATALTA